MDNSFRINSRYVDFLSVVGLFFLLSAPSLKLIYSSDVMNILALVFLLPAFLIKFKFKFSQLHLIVFGLWSVFSILLFLFLLISGNANSFECSSKYLFLLFSIYTVILVANYDVLRHLSIVLLVWGIVLSLWQIFIGIKTSRELGQHYLTVAMPIGAAISFSFVNSLTVGKRLINRIIMAVISLLFLLALSKLLSRGALIFTCIITITLFFYSTLFNSKNSIASRLLTLVLTVSIVSTIIYFLIPLIDFRQVGRIMKLLESSNEESRIGIYLYSLELIKLKPLFGYGTGSTSFLYNSYPHNIFLDILVQGGIVLLIPFVLFVLLYFYTVSNLVKSYACNPFLIGFCAMSLFFFLQWNTSFSLAGAYVPIGSMILLIIGFQDYKCRNMISQ